MITWQHVDLHYGQPTPGVPAPVIAAGTAGDRERRGDDRRFT
jgi:hypothetical protein